MTLASVVGSKGQIVINKAVRDQLGIQPGWEAVQIVRGDHVEVYFLPPPTPGMSAGILRSGISRPDLWDEDAFHEAKEQAWAQAACERYAASLEDEQS